MLFTFQKVGAHNVPVNEEFNWMVRSMVNLTIRVRLLMRSTSTKVVRKVSLPPPKPGSLLTSTHSET